jgi:hypothetical protein
MSSSVTQDASSHPPPSHGHSSDHDSSGDECERFGSFCQVQVVDVAPVTAASPTSASSVTSIAAPKAGDASDKVEHLETPYDGLKLKISCMPVLRLKVYRLLHSATVSSSYFFYLTDIGVTEVNEPTMRPLPRCSKPRAAGPVFFNPTRSAS